MVPILRIPSLAELLGNTRGQEVTRHSNRLIFLLLRSYFRVITCIFHHLSGHIHHLHTVDGSEIRRSPVEVGSFIPLFTMFYTSQLVSRISFSNSSYTPKDTAPRSLNDPDFERFGSGSNGGFGKKLSPIQRSHLVSRCILYTYIFIYTYLEPICPLFLGFNNPPIKTAGAPFGLQVVYALVRGCWGLFDHV